MASAPQNPFMLPERDNNEAFFRAVGKPSLPFWQRNTLKLVKNFWPECAERTDSDIGAFLSEEFALRDDKSEFHSRFLTLYINCNAAFGSLNHSHCLWAFKEDFSKMLTIG